MLKVLELFAGIGACSKALKRLGIEHEIVDAVEIDKYAMASFNEIHGTNFEVQDIKEWDKDLKDIDLITHGSPCQDFSVAGKQAGGDIGSGTRSSLMYETIRIVGKLRPKYVVWENVKNLLSKKHKHNFDAYIETMNILGYNSYYQVLNAKDYGIPQNRERVFTVSIRKDIDKGFEFPQKEELKLRLKDMLEENVDEKYYLNDAQIERIKTTTYNVGKTRIQEKDYCDTLCARDWKDPKCVRIGGMYGQTTRWGLYDDKGIAPTMVAAMGEGGGYIPMIEDPKCVRVGQLDSTYDQSGRVYSQDGISPTIMSNSHNGGYTPPKIITHNIQQVVKVRVYPVDIEALKTTLRTAKLNTDLNNKQIAEMLNIPQTQVEHYFRTDNSFAIPSPEIWLKLKEILGITTNEFDESIMTFEEKEGVYEKANRVYDEQGLAPTLTQQEEKVVTNLKIRKLTPKETWRLMGFDDEDFEKVEKVNSNTQLYKQAGNSIVVNVLEKIFKNLFRR